MAWFLGVHPNCDLGDCHLTLARKIRKCGFLVVLWAAQSAAQAAAQSRFDLYCNLQEVNTFHPHETNAFSRHVSIDLGAGFFCIWGEKTCNRLHKIARVTDDEIRLFDIDSTFMNMEASINRTSLVWTNHVHIKEFIDSGGDAVGPCRQAPFTPFSSLARIVP